MSDYPMLISNKLHSFRNFYAQLLIVKLVINMRLKIDVGIKLISYGLRSG